MADQPEEEEVKKKGGILKILLFVLLALLLVGAGLGGGYFLFGKAPLTPSEEIDRIIERKLEEAGQLPAEGEEGAEAEDAAPTKTAKPTDAEPTFVTSYFEFPTNFTTNLKASRKFLQLGVGVSTQYDESVIANVETHELALRSEILGTISEFTEEDIVGKAGRDRLADAMRDAVNEKLMELENFGGVEDVYFTTFILQ